MTNTYTTDNSQKNGLKPDPDTDSSMLDLYISHSLTRAIMGAIVMTVLAIIVWDYFDNSHIIIWLAYGYSVYFVMALIFPWLQRNISTHNLLTYKKITALVMVTASGIVWGSTSWLFLDTQHIELFVFIIVIIAGICAWTVPTNAPYLPTVWIFVSTSLGMLIIELYSINYFSIIGLAVIYGLGLMHVASRIHGIILNSITIDKRNEVLLHETTQARDAAVNASKAKSQFLATASHDLRQPLHAIMLLTNLLKLKANNDEIKNIADNMEHSTDAMMSLFNSILDVSRLDAGIVQINMTTIDLNKVIDNVQRQFMPIANKKGLAFNIDYQILESLPSLLVVADEVHLERCLNNIINNAIKFTTEGSITIKISETENNQVQISINDTGSGIEESDINKIFKEFTQATSFMRAQSQGLGLGLFIVDRLTKLMSIKLSVTSKVNEGSTFTLTINKSDERSLPTPKKQTTTNKARISGLRVLIIDDDDDVRTNLANLLTNWGCKTFIAATLSEAIDASQKATSIDALLVDYGLRDGITGLDVIQQLYDTQLPNRPPALIITGDVSTQSMTKLNNSKIPYLHKPAKPIKIRNFLLRNCVRKSET